VIVVGVGALVANLRRSATGRQLLAVRTNERAAAAGGIDVTRAKLLAFAVSSAIAGLGGALSAYRFGSVSATTFGSFTSIAFLAFAYLGGITSVTGAVIGGMFVANGVAFTALHDWFGVDPGLTNLMGGIGLILTAILNPEGVAGGLSMAGRRLAAVARPRRRRVPGVLAVAVTEDGVVS
jgi:branched-chain amino acid transport system permease protein